MKFFLDFFPLIGFFAVYYQYDIITATGALVLFSIIQIAGYWLVTKSVEKMHLISLGLVVVFGGMTVLMNDPIFIKWKVTLINWLFGAIILVRLFFFKAFSIQALFKNAMPVGVIPPTLWRHVDLAWAGFFVAMGWLNLAVAFYLSESVWVNFKVFGLMIATMLMVGYTIYRLSPYLNDEHGAANDEPSNPNQKDN